MSRAVGRPREVEDPVPVKVLIPALVYDRLDQQARQEDRSVPALIRELISVPVRPEEGSALRAVPSPVSLPLAGLGAEAVKSAKDFESAFSEVRKTVDEPRGVHSC